MRSHLWGQEKKVGKHKASAYSVYQLCVSTHVSHSGGQIWAYAMLPIYWKIHKNIGKTFFNMFQYFYVSVISEIHTAGLPERHYHDRIFLSLVVCIQGQYEGTATDFSAV